MIKAIVFDCFGVLTTDLWKEFCASLPLGAVVERAHELNHAYDAGTITRQMFLEGVHDATGLTPPEVEKSLDGELEKNTELLRYISELKNHYKIGLLSNIGSSWIRDQFLTSQEQVLFDEMVFSFEVGMIKPDPRIFELTCERLGVTLAETILVDDIERYCEAAKRLGMKAVLYQNFGQLRSDLKKMLS